MGIERSGYNNLTVQIYSSGSTPIYDPDRLLEQAQNIQFDTVYPGGLFVRASFYVKADITRQTPFKHANRIIIANDATTVFEGDIVEIAYSLTETEQGFEVTALGYWSLLAHRYQYNRYLDRRYSARQYRVWSSESLYPENYRCSFSHTNELRITPNKTDAWTSGQFAAFQYRTNGATNVRRITFNYDLQEAAQAWELQLYDATNATTLWSVTASGTGSADITASPSSAFLEFRLYARANQTPVGTVYGQITNLLLYGERHPSAGGGTMSTPTEIMQDICARMYAPFSNSSVFIAANSYDMSPFGFTADDWSSLDKVMMRLTSFSSDNSKWAVGVRESELVSGNTQGIIFYEQYPPLTDWDYAIRIEEIDGNFKLVTSSLPDELINEAFTLFTGTDGLENYGVTATVQESVDKYYLRQIPLDTGEGVTDPVGAGKVGETFVAARKDLRYYVSGPIRVKGAIRKKSGEPLPASQVRAGKRLKIENFTRNFGDISGTDFTFLISHTSYNDDDETVSISLGRPDNLAMHLAKLFEVEGKRGRSVEVNG